MKPIELIHGGDRALEARVFEVNYDYERLKEIMLKKWAENEPGPNATASAAFLAVVEFLQIKGYVLSKREDDAK